MRKPLSKPVGERNHRAPRHSLEELSAIYDLS
jgi:hypothetical protein